jgi:adenine C2-methylase RlmN of 23S rRNA A2503 and tRNA A37
MKIKLLGMNLEDLKKVVAEEGLPGFTAKQIAQWLYVKKVRSIDDMTNLSKVARARLSEKYEVGVIGYGGLQLSSDGTKKYLFPVSCSHKRGLNLVCPEEEGDLINEYPLQQSQGSPPGFFHVHKQLKP